MIEGQFLNIVYAFEVPAIIDICIVDMISVNNSKRNNLEGF